MKYACAGTLPVVEVFDEITNEKIIEFKAIEGHTSKIFCVKFDSEDANILFSGGWDRNVLMWDLRAAKRVAAINGPMICGEAIDTDSRSFKLLTGSHAKSDNISLWDIRTMGHLRTIPWATSSDFT